MRLSPPESRSARLDWSRLDQSNPVWLRDTAHTMSSTASVIVIVGSVATLALLIGFVMQRRRARASADRLDLAGRELTGVVTRTTYTSKGAAVTACVEYRSPDGGLHQVFGAYPVGAHPREGSGATVRVLVDEPSTAVIVTPPTQEVRPGLVLVILAGCVALLTLLAAVMA